MPSFNSVPSMAAKAAQARSSSSPTTTNLPPGVNVVINPHPIAPPSPNLPPGVDVIINPHPIAPGDNTVVNPGPGVNTVKPVTNKPYGYWETSPTETLPGTPKEQINPGMDINRYKLGEYVTGVDDTPVLVPLYRPETSTKVTKAAATGHKATKRYVPAAKTTVGRIAKK